MFAVGDIVVVTARTGVGENKPGGVGRVTEVSEDGSVDVKYVLGGRERRIPLNFVDTYASGEERAKRTIHGRCRRCGCLVVDCLHAQPDERDGSGAAEDVVRRKALAKRRKLANSWHKAVTGRTAAPYANSGALDCSSSSSSSFSSSSSEEDDDDDCIEDGNSLDSDEDDIEVKTTQAVEDIVLSATQPVDTHCEPAPQAVEISDSGSEDEEVVRLTTDDARAEDLDDVFIAIEDDGESMPPDLASLAPSKWMSKKSLRRRMQRLQRFVETRGLRHARDEVANLRVRAAQVEDSDALDALERAASNVRAFVLSGLRRRGIDVADACYRRLAARGARAGLDAAACKQDLLDDALRDVENDLDAAIEIGRDRCRRRGNQNEGFVDDGRNDDAKLYDIWGWELDLSENALRRQKTSRRKRAVPRQRDTASCREDDTPYRAVNSPRQGSRSRNDNDDGGRRDARSRRESKSAELARHNRDAQFGTRSHEEGDDPQRREDVRTRRRRRRDMERTQKKRRRRVIVEAATIQAFIASQGRPATRFGAWVEEEDDEISVDGARVSLLRRLIDDGAASADGACFEASARKCRCDALELLRTGSLHQIDWATFVPAALISIDAADRASVDKVEIDELRLSLLGRAAVESGDTAVGIALARCLVSVSARDDRWTSSTEDQFARLAARAWRAAASAAPAAAFWPAVIECLGRNDTSIACRVLTCAVRALSAEPCLGDAYSTGVWTAAAQIYGCLDFSCPVRACRLATALCAASATTQDELLWQLWEVAVTDQSSGAVSRLALVSPSSRYFASAPNEPCSLRAATETVVCFAAAHPPGLRRRRLVLELVRRRALPAVRLEVRAAPLVASCLLSLATSGLADVDPGFVRTSFAVAKHIERDDSAIVAAALAELATSREARLIVATWLAELTNWPSALAALGNILAAWNEPPSADLILAAAAAIRTAAVRNDARLASKALRPTLIDFDVELGQNHTRPSKGLDESPFSSDELDWNAVDAAVEALEEDQRRRTLATRHRPVLDAAVYFLGSYTPLPDKHFAFFILDAALLLTPVHYDVGSVTARLKAAMQLDSTLFAELLRRQAHHPWAAPVVRRSGPLNTNLSSA